MDGIGVADRESLADFLRRKCQDTIFDGKSPRGVDASGRYIESFIRKEGLSQTEIARTYGCQQHTISRVYRELIVLDEVDTYVAGELSISRPHLTDLLASRRATARGIGLALGEPSGRVAGRLRALEKELDRDAFQEIKVEGKSFFTVEESKLPKGRLPYRL